VLRVSDTGIGMSADLAARVFELFVQGDRELDRALGGLGIGLTLVRRLTELQGGSVTGESPGPGQGSTFTVRLPAIAEPERVAAGAATVPDVAGCEILLVEDNDDAREMLRELLEIAGHRVRVAADGPTGLAAALEHVPDVALVDIGLPGLDGYEVARRIRAWSDGPRRPFLVALTGYGLPEDHDAALRAGFDEHLVKPVDEDALRTVLARAGARDPVGLASPDSLQR
jgi:CheY-like chemotaxis protein